MIVAFYVTFVVFAIIWTYIIATGVSNQVKIAKSLTKNMQIIYDYMKKATK